MVLKSYAKINLSLTVGKKIKNGLHKLQSVYCLIDLFDQIYIKKLKRENKDKIHFNGQFSKTIDKSNNSIKKTLNFLRKFNFISNYYSVNIIKKIPVSAGLGGGTSNAAALIKYLPNKKIDKKTLSKMSLSIGSDLKLFFNSQGYMDNLDKVIKLKKNFNLNFLIVYPNIQCSTKKIFSKVEKYSKKRKFLKKNFKNKIKFIDYLVHSNNDLQLIVEKKFPIVKKILLDINELEGCLFSRMTGSGSVCYGLFKNKNCLKAALKKLAKKYPKFSISIAKTI